MRKSLKEIAKDKTIVFVVDELDRCLPQYAIKVLERLHHITEGIDNFVTIIAIDKKHLLHSVADAFGYDKNGEFKDSEKYLKKFVNFYIPLDSGAVDKKISEKYEAYINMFITKECNYQIDFDEYFRALFCGIDMREQEHLMEKAEIVHSRLADILEEHDYTVMYMELLLVVFYSNYEIDIDNMIINIKNQEKNDTLNNFRDKFKGLHIEKKRIVIKALYSKEVNLFEYLNWYATFLPKCNFFGILPDSIKSVDNIFRDIIDVEGINMEENLQFLYKGSFSKSV